MEITLCPHNNLDQLTSCHVELYIIPLDHRLIQSNMVLLCSDGSQVGRLQGARHFHEPWYWIKP